MICINAMDPSKTDTDLRRASTIEVRSRFVGASNLGTVCISLNGMRATISVNDARELAAALVVCADNSERDK